MVAFQVGIGLLVAIPLVAATQPFVPGGPLVIVIIVVVLAMLAFRALRDFDGHVRAGSELLVEILRQPEPELAKIESVLPGFEGLATIKVLEGSPAVGKSLADLDVRRQAV